MIKQATKINPINDKFIRGLELETTQEKRLTSRIWAFCQVFDLEKNWFGISFNITEKGISLSLPNTWTKDSPFSVILKRADLPSLPEVTISVEPIWRTPYNQSFDEIAGKIVQVDSSANFEAFLQYCQEAGPSGLFSQD